MSSQTDIKWEKYFKGKEVETFIKANSSNTRGKNYLKVQNNSGNLINKVLLDHGHPITVFESNTYHYTGTFKNHISVDAGKHGTGWVHINCIDKVKDGKATFQIESTKLINRGENIVVPNLNGEDNVPCKKFTSAQQLAASIIEGLRNEPSVPDYILEQVVQFFYDYVDIDAGTIKGDSKFIWNAGISDKEKNQLAVYLGELLIGYMLLVGRAECFSVQDIIKYPIEYFAVPTNPSFPGVDSFIQYKNESTNPNAGKYLISSKAGNKGASPSIWKNIMPHLNYNKLDANDNKTLKKLYDICKALDGGKITGRKSMKYVYRYGVEVILEYEIGPSTVDRKGKQGPIINPEHFYNALKAGKPYPPVYNNVILKAKKIQKNLNSTQFKYASMDSVTTAMEKGVGMSSFFCRYISDSLNNEPESLKRMRNTVSGQKIYQAYLNTVKFRKGEVFFTTKKITTADLITTGSKSGATKIDMSNTVNYDLIFSN